MFTSGCAVWPKRTCTHSSMLYVCRERDTRTEARVAATTSLTMRLLHDGRLILALVQASGIAAAHSSCGVLLPTRIPAFPPFSTCLCAPLLWPCLRIGRPPVQCRLSVSCESARSETIKLKTKTQMHREGTSTRRMKMAVSSSTIQGGRGMRSSCHHISLHSHPLPAARHRPPSHLKLSHPSPTRPSTPCQTTGPVR
jgi:hypothetical protein